MKLNRHIMKIIIFLIGIAPSLFSCLHSQNINSINQYFDTLAKNEDYWVEYINRTELSLQDSILLDSINSYVNANYSNPNKIKQLRNILEPLILNNEIPYILAKELLLFYLNSPYNENIRLSFFINASFQTKRYKINKNGSNLIYLFYELSTDCQINHKFRLMILNSNFLKEEFNEVKTKNYQLFFKNCNNNLSLDEMIKKSCDASQKALLIKLKSIVLQSSNK